ncbi:MAG TPA: DUF3144 domain-containing protein [Crenotrichaceae bacterium]|nr:DUF3144 domain-containing protein [Crenotrichaceae bacterium]
MTPDQQYDKAVNEFISLANQLKDKEYPMEVVSAALMSASGVYATYVASGGLNNGFLLEPGVAKVAEAYRNQLQEIQDVKKKAAEDAGLRPKDSDTQQSA